MTPNDTRHKTVSALGSTLSHLASRPTNHELECSMSSHCHLSGLFLGQRTWLSDSMGLYHIQRRLNFQNGVNVRIKIMKTTQENAFAIVVRVF